MTDKELLELAAKAAGVFLTPEQFAKECPSPWDEEWEPWYNTECNSMIGMQTCYNYEGELSGWAQYEWNPLSDDGDAFRLAVKLELFGETSFTYEFMEASGDAEKTRMVIVRSAASIGENME